MSKMIFIVALAVVGAAFAVSCLAALNWPWRVAVQGADGEFGFEFLAQWLRRPFKHREPGS